MKTERGRNLHLRVEEQRVRAPRERAICGKISDNSGAETLRHTAHVEVLVRGRLREFAVVFVLEVLLVFSVLLLHAVDPDGGDSNYPIALE